MGSARMCLALSSQRVFWNSQMFALQSWPPATKKFRLSLPSMLPMSWDSPCLPDSWTAHNTIAWYLMASCPSGHCSKSNGLTGIDPEGASPPLSLSAKERGEPGREKVHMT